MRLILQRVTEATVRIAGRLYSEIGSGLCILVGIEPGDSDSDIDWLVQKVASIRIFSDTEGKMNLSIQEISGKLLVISQFTLHASTKKGNRPSFIRAANPEYAESMYSKFINKLRSTGLIVETGVFGADMQISLTNNGPVTILIDSKLRE